MKNLFFLITMCCVVISCSRKKPDGSMPETKNITNEDFKEHRLAYEVLPIEMTDFVWTMSMLDTLAFFLSEGGEDLVPIYDLKNNRRVGGVIKKGLGPTEMTHSSTRVQINAVKGFAAIYDGQQKLFMAFPLDVLTRLAAGDTNRAFTPFVKFYSEKFNFDISALDTNVFAGLAHPQPVMETQSLIYSDRRITFYDRQGKVTAEKGGYYRTPEIKLPEEMNFAAFSGRIINRDDGERIVIPNEDTDRIEIYDGQGNIIRLIKGPDYFNPDVVDVSKGNMIGYLPGEKSRTAYAFPVAKKSGFWAIYYGLSHKELEGRSEDSPTTILSFDWDGNPLDKYIIPADVRFFDVDESRGLLYGMMMTEEGEQKIIKAKYR